MDFIAFLIDRIIDILIFLVIVHALLSFFMSPYHPIREFIDRLVNPLLAPIRRIMPNTGMIDFSPLVLIILLQIIGSVVVRFLYSL